MWQATLEERRGFNKAAVALAAEQARILWVLLARAWEYRIEKAKFDQGKGSMAMS